MMIETIYNETSSEDSKPNVNIRLPKNIKQIGQGNSSMNYQIYIEENVLFYIKQKSITEEELRYGVLLGEKKQGNGYTYIFINGVIEVENILAHTIIFSDDIWTSPKPLTFLTKQYILKLNLLKEPEKENIIRPDAP